LRGLVRGRFGLAFDDDNQLGLLGDVARRGAARKDTTIEQWLGLFARDVDEQRVVVQELTVTETYFFRNVEQFRALTEAVLPRMTTSARGRPLRLLSAACASGEEPGSLAILLRESGIEGSVHAVDVNPAMLEKAAAGRYSPWSLRETSPERRALWFHEAGRELLLDARARSLVTFEERNLVDDDALFWRPAAFDVVLCRNVLMYFTPDAARAVVARLAASLVPGGFLFLGHAETMRGLSQDFSLHHTHGTFYYQRRDGLARDRGSGSARAVDVDAVGVAARSSALLAADDSWIDAIRRASERIDALSTSESMKDAAGGDADADAAAAALGWDVGPALELLRQERYSEALVLLQALPSAARRDPDVLLLKAVLCTHSGALDVAEEACRALLELDGFSAGAHYVIALCREDGGDRAGALDHDQIAAHLDAGFAMPRLHLGLLARRVGDDVGARRELGLALALLQREDPARLLLFGGGFGREALVGLCRAELRRAGGTP
jgi:chemotaxis protein methyltransferase CheR